MPIVDFELSISREQFNKLSNKLEYSCKYCSEWHSSQDDHKNNENHINNMLEKVDICVYGNNYTKADQNYKLIECLICNRKLIRGNNHFNSESHFSKLCYLYNMFKKNIVERKLKLLEKKNLLIINEKNVLEQKVQELNDKLMSLDKENLILKKQNDDYKLDFKKIAEYLKLNGSLG